MRPIFSTLWLIVTLALCSTMPLACAEEPEEPEPCKENCGGAGGGAPTGCETNADCDPGLVCQGGECGLCSSDGQCAKEESCDPASLLCTVRPGWGTDCQTHQECPLGSLCSQGLCLLEKLVTACGASGQCGEGLRCNRKVGPPPVCEEDLGCFVNEDCSDNEVCNVGTAKCQYACTPENQKDICAARERCVEGLCVECVEDGDCALGLECNVAAGLCVGAETCFTNRDCDAGLVCNKRIGICTDPPPPCTSDVDCVQDERCDLASGRCMLRACLPDLDAPNHEKELAAPLVTGEKKDLVVCENEQKWYRLSLGVGDRLSITIAADVLTVDGFDVQLLTDDDRVLQSSVHEIKLTINQAGDYYLRVRTRGGRVHYSLNTVISKGTPCRNDEFEPNESASEAHELTAGSHPGLVICPVDTDWFEITVPVNRGVEVTLAQAEGGNLDLELYDGDGQTLLDEDKSTDKDKFVSAAQVGGGRAFIKISASDSRTESAYGLQISLP